MISAASDLGREAARRLARQELSDRRYSDARPPLLVRLATQLFQALGDLLDAAGASLPGGRAGLVLLLLLLVGAVLLVVLRLRPSRTGSAPALFAAGPPLGADDHRRRADDLAGQGDFAGAVRERLRAVVRELEARGVLDPRPGRTAAEIATEGGVQVPGVAAQLHRAAAVFDEIWYGGRTADAASYRVVTDVDRAVRDARLVAR